MKRSALALIGSLVGLIYLMYLGIALFWMESPRMFTLQVAGHVVQMAYMLPYTLVTALAVLFNWIAFLAKKRGVSLLASILYCAAVPLLPPLFAVTLALSLIALVDFFRFPARDRKGEKANAPVDPALEMLDEPIPGSVDGPDEPASGATKPDESDEPDDTDEPLDESDLALDDDDADLQLDPIALDEELEKSSPDRPRVDGMAIFLGLFMAVAAIALIGIIAYGMMGGKLPFMP
jgi:hypothetical protein